MHSEANDWLNSEFLHSRYFYQDGNLFSKSVIKNGKNLLITGTKDKDGYARVCVRNGKKVTKVMLHRLIFCMHHGNFPEIVDHVDRNIKNNCISNLRAANKNENQWNRGVKISSKSGVRGVVIKNGKFCAQCKVYGKRYHLGTFDTLEHAEEVLKEFRTKNHKEFATYG